MKLRIKGNSIRLRLSKSEIQKIGLEGFVQDKIQFPGEMSLKYAIQVSDIIEILASFSENTITISLPKTIANAWVNSEQVGFDKNLVLDHGESLYVLIEKDFQCLTQRPNEDESDNYQHPQVEHSQSHQC